MKKLLLKSWLVVLPMILFGFASANAEVKVVNGNATGMPTAYSGTATAISQDGITYSIVNAKPQSSNDATGTAADDQLHGGTSGGKVILFQNAKTDAGWITNTTELAGITQIRVKSGSSCSTKSTATYGIAFSDEEITTKPTDFDKTACTVAQNTIYTYEVTGAPKYFAVVATGDANVQLSIEVTYSEAGDPNTDPDPEPEPFVGDYTPFAYAIPFTANIEKGTSTGQNADAMSKAAIDIKCTSAALGRTDEYRIYAGATLTVSSEYVNIVKVVFYAEGSSNLPSDFAVQGNNGTYDDEAYVWTGLTHEVIFKNTSTKQIKLSKIEVYSSPFTIVETEEETEGFDNINKIACVDGAWVGNYVVLEDPIAYYNSGVDLNVKMIDYTREVVPGNWNAVCLPFSVDPCEDLDYLWSETAFTVLKLCEEQTTDNGYVTFEEVEDDETLEANTPYLIMSGYDSIDLWANNKTLGKSDVTTLHEGNNIEMYGTLGYTYIKNDENKTYYGLKDNVFYHAGEGTKTMKPFRGYIAVSKSSPAQLNVRVADTPEETEGIEAVEVEQMQEGVFYNLKGQKVNKPSKGLYIFNGQKVMIK